MSALTEKALMAFVRVHDALYQRSGGLIGHRIPGAPNSLLLHTVGAKTGMPRTNTLSYALDGDTYLVVASNGGDRRSPGWYHNLKANADVEVNVGRRRFAAVAQSVLPDDADYARLWRIVNANNADRYDAYQARTDRPIPVVRITASDRPVAPPG